MNSNSNELNISNEQNISKIDYKYEENRKESIISTTDSAKNSTNRDRRVSSFNFSIWDDDNQTITSLLQDVENIKKYPYIAIGTITVKFPNLEEDLEYTCFLIDTNVVVTLASNIKDKNKGGRATKIKTTFSDEEVNQKNVHIQGEDSKEDEKSAEKIELMDKRSSKLAVILYEKDIGSEWIGVETVKPEEFNENQIYFSVVFTLGLIDNDANKKEQKLKEVIAVNNSNPFRKFIDSTNLNNEDKLIAEKVPGSLIYYQDSKGGGYAVGIVNEIYEFQYFDEDAMKFLANMVNQGRLLRKKTNDGKDTDSIVKLDLHNNKLTPYDIKYLIEFDLKNLQYLNLSSNSIKPIGAVYLSRGDFRSLLRLNLSSSEIGDQGLNELTNGSFTQLVDLYLCENSISSQGIEYLVKADFVKKLMLLDLSLNLDIKDLGIKIMKDHTGWDNLTTLFLDATNLTDLGLKYLSQASMRKLRQLSIMGNNFTAKGKTIINGLRMNHISVVYKTKEEREKEKREKEKREKEKRKKEGKNK